MRRHVPADAMLEGVTITCGALLLAGGRGSRMGGIRKPLLVVGDRSLLAHALRAASGCDPLTIVGDVGDVGDGLGDRDGDGDGGDNGPSGTDRIREDPPYGGPVAGIVAGLSAWASRRAAPEWTLVLACDLPGARAAAARLRSAIPELSAAVDGVCLADASGRRQWLTGVYRTAALTERARSLPDAGRHAAVRALLDGLAVEALRAPAVETADIDTWEDLEVARRAMRSEET